MSETVNHSATIFELAYASTQARRRDLLAALTSRHGWVVQSGPFAGMTLTDRVAWGDGDLLPKLLGFYEAELQPILTDLATAGPELVVNIGAAEGFYAIGLARLIPGAFVHAFDTAPVAQDICRYAAGLNEVGSRISVAGACTPDLLQAILPRGRNPLVVCDCEGYERELIDPARVPALRRSVLVVECHDFIDASITQTLVTRLSTTHTLTGIREGARDPNQSPFLQTFDSLDRWLAVCEYRPTMMHWLIAIPK